MVLHSELGSSVWPCGPGSDCISGGSYSRITNTLLDLQLRTPHTCTGPVQDWSLQDVFSCLVLKLPSEGAALKVSCRSSPCCKSFSGVCSVVAVSFPPVSFKVKELLPQSPGLVLETKFPKLRFWGLVQAISIEWNRQQRLLVLSGMYSHGLSAGLVASTESDSLSCQVTLQHLFPSCTIPFPRILLSALLRTLVLGLGSHLGLAAAPSWLEHTISPTGFPAVFSASAGH